MPSDIPAWVYIVFTAVTAVGVLIQAGVLLGMFLALIETKKKGEQLAKQVGEQVLPMMASTRVVLEEMGPKLKTITENLAEISETVKIESRKIKTSVDDVLEKTRVQTARVDEIVTDTLAGISHAGATIQQGINVPVRQISGIVSGIKAGFEVLRGKAYPDGSYARAEREADLYSRGVSE